MNEHQRFMKMAISEGKKNLMAPFGCVIVNKETKDVVSRGVNYSKKNRILHAEIVALLNLDKNSSESRLSLYSTAEPCPMCTGAAIWSGIEDIIFGVSIYDLIQLGWNQINETSNSLIEKSNWVDIKVIPQICKFECLELFENANFLRNQKV